MTAKLVGGPWAGLAVFLLLSLVGAVLFLLRHTKAPPAQTVPRPGIEGESRILVVANETVGGETLREEIRKRSDGSREQVLVVCPALNSLLRYWTSDEDGARANAQERLENSLAQLAQEGIEARGQIGDADPLQAIDDALRTFGADEIIISTHPEGRSNWLERGVVANAEARFPVPITHVVVDIEAEEPTEPQVFVIAHQPVPAADPAS